jgi:antitoxin component YwqK of YwqJK toxin-antitoxin module
MKKLTILLLCSILISFNSYGLFGLFEKTVCVETDAQERNGLVYLPNQQEPFSGNNLCKYENGQKKFEGNIKDGKLDGKITAWYENGQKKAETNLIDGKIIDGKDIKWYKNGQKKYEKNYKKGKKDGKWTEWDENGQIEEEANYKDGKCISGDCSLLVP